jgi:hypothetical protein
VQGTVATRVRPSQDGCPRQVFEPKDIALLASPTACLNDVCINGCMVLLFSELRSLATGHCALLSSHDLPRIRYNASDDILWRNVSWTFYWEKDVWILPIHRPSSIGHWVLCVIRFSSKELHLFDSFAEMKPWKRDVKVSVLISVVRRPYSALKGHYEINRSLPYYCPPTASPCSDRS